MKRYKLFCAMLSFSLVLMLLLSLVEYGDGAARAAYKGADAAKYARTYALKRNTAYDYYKGADCTNFTSQCLVSGGFPVIALPQSEAEKCIGIVFKDKIYRSYAYFSHKKYSGGLFGLVSQFVSTTPWSLAGAKTSGDNCYGFYDYIKHYGYLPVSFTFKVNVEAKLQDLFNYAKVGDIIQLRYKGSSSSVDHSYIITERGYNRTVDPNPGQPYIRVCAHTGDRYDSNFFTLVRDGTIKDTDTVLLWRITAFNMDTLSVKKPK